MAARGATGRDLELTGRRWMLLRPYLNDAGSCASYIFGCTSHNTLAVVDPHADFVEDYVAAADAIGAPIVAVFETHVQADHVSGLPALLERTGATGYLPPGPGSSGSARP
jgi:Metallo-beta-lactamase superfamily.